MASNMVVKNASLHMEENNNDNESSSSTSSKSLSFDDIMATDASLDIFLSFINPELGQGKEYFELRAITSSSNYSIYYFSITQFLFLSCWLIVGNLFYYEGDMNTLSFFIINLILILLAIVICFLLCIDQRSQFNNHRRETHQNNNNEHNHPIIVAICTQILSICRVSKYLVYYQGIYAFIVCLMPGLSLVAKTYIGSCYNHNNNSNNLVSISNNYHEVFQICNSMNPCSILPIPIFLLNFSCPVLMKILLNSPYRSVMVLNWCTSFLTTLGSIYLLNSHNDNNNNISIMTNSDNYIILIFYLMNFFFLYEYEYSNRSMFLLWIKNKNDYKTNIETKYEQNISLNLSEELRNIISNTAHDMKSPCTGVLLGLESLETSIKTTNIDNYLFHQKQHLELIRYMHSTIAFMMMSINRSMDFTKIQGRLDLIPIYENIELSATINWAIECILGQNETNIKLISSITSLYGYTDKTWIKDNLLCLIGNAVKFTTEGTQVQIKVAKIQTIPNANANNNNTNSSHIYDHTTTTTTLSVTNVNHNNQKMLTDHENTEIEIQMIDNGVNTEDLDRAKFFEQPSQRQRKEGGLGIGLYVLAHRIKALKGTYGSESRTDGQSGSVFWFRIPFDRYRKTNSMTRRHSHHHHHHQATNRNSQDSNSSIHSNNSSHYSRLSWENGHNDNNANPSNEVAILDGRGGSVDSSVAATTGGLESKRASEVNGMEIDGHDAGNGHKTVAAVASSALTSFTRSLNSFRHGGGSNSNSNMNNSSFNTNKHVGFATSNDFTNENEPFSKASSSSSLAGGGGSGTATLGDEKTDDHNDNSEQLSFNGRQQLSNSSISNSGSRQKLKSNKVSPDMAIEYLTKQSEKIETSVGSNSDDENSPLHSSNQQYDNNSNSNNRNINNNSNNNSNNSNSNSSYVSHGIRKVSSGSNNGNSISHSHSRQNSNHKIVPINNGIVISTSTNSSSSINNSSSTSNSNNNSSSTNNRSDSRRNSLDKSNRASSLSSIANANSISLRDEYGAHINNNTITSSSSNNNNTALNGSNSLADTCHGHSNTNNTNTTTNTRNDLEGLVALVVDDSIPILKMTSYVLKRAGCKVTEAKNGSVALNAIHENRYDLILMDIQMPVMDGFQAVRHIRQHEMDMGKKRQIILGMSANAKGSMRKKCLKEGFDGFTAKPFTYEEILKLYRITLSDVENSMSTIAGSSAYLSVEPSFGMAGSGIQTSTGGSGNNIDNNSHDDNSSVHSRSSIHSRNSLS